MEAAMAPVRPPPDEALRGFLSRLHGDVNGEEARRAARRVGCDRPPLVLSQPSLTGMLLTPPGYGGRLIELVVILARPRRGDGDDPAAGGWDLDVGRPSVAAESTLGQVVERSLGLLRLPRRPPDVGEGWVSHATLWRIVSHNDEAVVAEQTRVGPIAFPGGTPSLRLILQSPATVARDALHSGDAVVLLATDSPNDYAGNSAISSLLDALVDLFFPPHRRYCELAKHPSVLAVATRLRLHAQPRLVASSPLGVDLEMEGGTTATLELGTLREPMNHPEGLVNPVQADDVSTNPSTVAVSHPSSVPSTLERSDNAPLPPSEWPFRVPPPLSQFRFANNKMNPRGAKEASGSGSTRVVAAVFVEDASLPIEVAPFCIALGQRWCAGKLIERLKEEVATSSGLPLSAFTGYDVFILTADPPTKINREDRTVPISNGDVLLLSKTEHPVDIAVTGAGGTVKRAVAQELDRMRQLKGKEQAVLKMEMMKKCALM
ncbi:unnamed protein product [Phytomonas sp. EM1]|nr:unnamed protein product [Phytomonas sp. EM1]|eukprot:CCW63425.1 unnamed protein product [Phytomonas sp. isolate EM1]